MRTDERPRREVSGNGVHFFHSDFVSLEEVVDCMDCTSLEGLFLVVEGWVVCHRFVVVLFEPKRKAQKNNNQRKEETNQ